MKVIYVAGKYQGATHDGRSYIEISHNILRAREYATAIWKLGAAALCPHMNTAHMEVDCSAASELFYKGDIELLRRSDALFLIPNWKESKGARAEREFAKHARMPIFTELAALEKWLDGHGVEGAPKKYAQIPVEDWERVKRVVEILGKEII